ncbi:hypothetical protein UK23_06045 [Lentzea aerocolonigenes]|uniref:ESX secretion-associated protein EspG n=1 Tax=Lentzea aerocolonigenes TaxID=68170 RepID=A0A0F0HDG4_LENAE|nr:hypothetical protein [Lentzea aerocolonigenes]KJK51678.1 hypothetical protein UK23_06045 [Lentzea aerocolonigenes]
MTPAPHRLVLTAGEFAYLVERMGVELPPAWTPTADIGPAEAGLIKKRVVDTTGGQVHRSVEKNLEILALPMVMLDTVAAIGDKGLHSMHTIAGPLGASLFELGDGGVEMSMFASADLGKELIRAVPPENEDGDAGIESRLGGGGPEQTPLHGWLPLAALQEMGAARLFRDADPGGPAAVVARLRLSGDEAALAQQVATETDGALRCFVVGRNGMTSQVSWVHTDGGWSGLDPEPDGSGRRMVRLEPAAREDLGMWVAPAVAGAL